MQRKCEYAESFFKGCIHNMGISENELQEERQSQPIAGYTAWLKYHAITDDVFSNYVRMIPCLYVSIPKTIARWEGSTLM
jgi:thiaminase